MNPLLGDHQVFSVVAAALVCLGATAPAAAQPSEAAAQSQASRYAKAAALCKGGDYAGAIDLLEELYQETRKPLLIFNQGRCFEDNGRVVPALNRFKAYLATGDTAQKQDVDRRLVALEQRGAFEADKACLAGDYQTGVQRLIEMHAETGKPIYLHAQARCFDQNRQYQRAATAFRDYLRVADVSSEERALITSRLQYLDSFLQRPPAAPTAAPPAASPSAPPVPASREAAAATSKPADPPGTAHPGRLSAGIVTTVVGGAALATGVVFAVMAKSHESSIEKAGKETEFFDASAYDAGRNAAKVATVTLIAGPVLLATGIGLVLWSRQAPAPPPSSALDLRIAPVLHADGGGAAFSLRY